MSVTVFNNPSHFPPQILSSFVKESAALDQKSVDDNLNKEKGYYGAFIQSQNKALSNSPVTFEDLQKWRALINESNLTSFKVKDAWLQSFNTRLKALEERHSTIDFVSFVGEMAYQFQQMDQQDENAGLMARLLINFVATRVDQPIIIFHVNERSAYQEASQSINKMRVLLANKVQEAVFGMNGEWMNRIMSGSTSKYVGPSPEEEILRVQWNELLVAQTTWKTAET